MTFHSQQVSEVSLSWLVVLARSDNVRMIAMLAAVTEAMAHLPLATKGDAVWLNFGND
jgi:hypothetical protein